MTNLKSSAVAGLVLALPLSGCLGYSTAVTPKIDDLPESWQKLPYHVAIVPMESDVVRSAPTEGGKIGLTYGATPEQSPEDGEDPEAALRMGRNWSLEQDHLVTEQLRAVLEENVFERVSILEPPSARKADTTLERDLTSDGLDATDAYWAVEAHRVQADLVLYVDQLQHPERVSGRPLAQNFGLFFVWPLSVLTPDREYSAEGLALDFGFYGVEQKWEQLRLDQRGLQDIATYDRDALGALQQFHLNDSDGLRRRFRISPGDLAVRFGDRVPGGPLSLRFWGTLFFPSSLQEPGSEAFQERLSTLFARRIAVDLAEDLAEGDYYFLERPGGQQQQFVLHASRARIERTGEFADTLLLSAPVEFGAELPRGRVRMGRVERDVVLFRASETQDLDQALIVATGGGQCAGVIDDSGDGTSGGTALMKLYIPLQSDARTVKDVEESRRTMDLQLILEERLDVTSSDFQSWTFDVEGLLTDLDVRTLFGSDVQAE